MSQAYQTRSHHEIMQSHILSLSDSQYAVRYFYKKPASVIGTEPRVMLEATIRPDLLLTCLAKGDLLTAGYPESQKWITSRYH